MEEVSNLSPTMPDPQSWPFKKWYSTDHTWFYHQPDTASIPKHDKHFYELIDRNLKVLCYFLHLHGCETTPSCEGHFYSRSELRAAWNKIKSEERKVRKEGLVVTDSETGEEVLFKNSHYTAPWKTFDDFLGEVGEKQKTGFIGILVPKKLEKTTQRMKENPYLSDNTSVEARSEEDGWLFSFTVRASSPSRQVEEWRKITRYFFNIFEGEQ